MGDVKGMEEGDGGKVEARYLLWNHLFDLWFHVAVHRFGFRGASTEGQQRLMQLEQRSVFRTNTSFQRQLITTSNLLLMVISVVRAYRGVGCNVWRKPHPWVCQGKGTEGD